MEENHAEFLKPIEESWKLCIILHMAYVSVAEYFVAHTYVKVAMVMASAGILLQTCLLYSFFILIKN